MTKLDSAAIVTGASSGIGHAVVRTLLAEGWTVVGISRRPAELDESQYHEFLIDLGNLDALAALVDNQLAPLFSDDRWKRIGLVNNAATPGFMRSVEEIEPQDLAQVLAVNVVAPVYLMGVAVRHTPAWIPLRIVNVSSGAATWPLPGLADYGSSKAALRLASMTLGAELRSGDLAGGARTNVAVMSYSPGVVDTPMQVTARSADSPWSRPFVGFHAQGQLVSPEAPAGEIVRFLAGDHAEMFVERRFGET